MAQLHYFVQLQQTEHHKHRESIFELWVEYGEILLILNSYQYMQQL